MSAGTVQIECSPGTIKLVESNPEMLQEALCEAGMINLEEAAVEEPWATPVDREETVIVEEKKITWLDAHVKLLLSTVEELRPQVGKSAKLRSKRKMWREIQRRFSENGYAFTELQIENKFRALERQFKKVKSHNKQTGRNRATCAYESEMTAIMADRPSVFPEVIIGASTMEDTSDSTPNLPETPILDFAVAENNDVRADSRNTSSTSTRNQKVDVGSELKAMREARQDFYERSLALREQHYRKKEELKKEKLGVLRYILDVLINLKRNLIQICDFMYVWFTN